MTLTLELLALVQCMMLVTPKNGMAFARLERLEAYLIRRVCREE